MWQLPWLCVCTLPASWGLISQTTAGGSAGAPLRCCWIRGHGTVRVTVRLPVLAKALICHKLF